VLFDLGGVLVEFGGPATLLRWLGDRLTPEQIWPMWLGSSVVRDFETGRVGPDVFADRLIADLGLPVDRGNSSSTSPGGPRHSSPEPPTSSVGFRGPCRSSTIISRRT